MRASDIINEMFIRHNSNTNNGYIIANGANLWVINSDEITDDVLNDIISTLNISNEDGKINDMYDMIYNINEDRPDILVMEYNNDTATIRSQSAAFAYNPRSSLLIKKVVKAISFIKYIHYPNTFDAREMDQPGEFAMASDFNGDLPDIAFHGTTLRWVIDIIKKGLQPTTNGNWKIKFTDRVFLSASMDVAKMHANSNLKNGRHFLDNIAAIVVLKIPDKSKISVDYDVSRMFYGNEHPETTANGYNDDALGFETYSDITAQTVNKYNPKTNFTRETGIFSYKGRIPASYIERILIGRDVIDDGDYTFKTAFSMGDNEFDIVRNNAELTEYIDDVDETYSVYDPTGMYTPYDDDDEDEEYEEDEEDEDDY